MIGCPCLGQTLSALNWVPLPAWHIDYTVSLPPKCLGNEWSRGWENGLTRVAQVLSSDNKTCVMPAQMKVKKRNSKQNEAKDLRRLTEAFSQALKLPVQICKKTPKYFIDSDSELSLLYISIFPFDKNPTAQKSPKFFYMFSLSTNFYSEKQKFKAASQYYRKPRFNNKLIDQSLTQIKQKVLLLKHTFF